MQVNTILVPTDFSADAEKALSTASEFAKLFHARIVVLHTYHVEVPTVTPMGGGYALPQSFYDDMQSYATAEVNRVTKGLVDQGIDATGVTLREPASTAIVAQAETLPADLIVMGTRGLSGLKHVFLGSVAERVVRTAPCPVLTVKAPA